MTEKATPGNQIDVFSYSRFSRTRSDYDIYAWCVYVTGPKGLYYSIREVEYALHPSFPNPVRVSSDPSICFAIQSEGWGGFDIAVRIILQDGQTLRRTYLLPLEKDAWPMGQIQKEFSNSTEETVYDLLMQDKWEWRKISTLAKGAGLDISESRHLLEKLDVAKAVRKAYYLSLDNQELWGATARVGLLPQPPG